MANKQKFIEKKRLRRRRHVRSKVQGDQEQPRLSIFRSNHHLGCQVIDDSAGKTLVSVSTRDIDIRDSISYGGNCDAATKIGEALARRALAKGIKSVRLDRGSYKYHGRVAALADAAREGGLQF